VIFQKKGWSGKQESHRDNDSDQRIRHEKSSGLNHFPTSVLFRYVLPTVQTIFIFSSTSVILPESLTQNCPMFPDYFKRRLNDHIWCTFMWSAVVNASFCQSRHSERNVLVLSGRCLVGKQWDSWSGISLEWKKLVTNYIFKHPRFSLPFYARKKLDIFHVFTEWMTEGLIYSYLTKLCIPSLCLNRSVLFGGSINLLQVRYYVEETILSKITWIPSKAMTPAESRIR